MEHHWQDGSEHLHLADTPTGLRLAVGNADAAAVNWKYPTALLAAEILRLAQRGADLQGAIDTLESQLFATQQEREGEKTMRAQAECRETLWQNSARETGERLRHPESELARITAQRGEQERLIAALFTRTMKQLDGVTRENRAKCLELAEAARRIRDLEAEVRSLRTEGSQTFEVLNSALAEKAGEIRLLEGGFKIAARVISRFEAVVEDAIGHVERARRAALANPGTSVKADLATVEQLDLAHEVLTGAVKGRAVKQWTDPTAVHLAWIAEERAAARQAAPGVETAATEPELATRLRNLEEQHAAILTGHGDRLKAVAEEVDHLREDFLASTEDFQRRLSAIEAGKE